MIFISMFVGFSYPALNPFVYFTFNSEYKKSFQELLGFRKRPKSSATNIASPTTEDSISKVAKPVVAKTAFLSSV